MLKTLLSSHKHHFQHRVTIYARGDTDKVNIKHDQ